VPAARQCSPWNPLSENRLQLIAESLNMSWGRPRARMVSFVDVEAEAVGSPGDTHPVEVADQAFASLENAIEHVSHAWPAS